MKAESVNIMVAATEAKEAAKGKKSLKARMKAAMQATKNHWTGMNESDCLRAAVAGLVLTCSPEEADRVKVEFNALCLLSNCMAAGDLRSLKDVTLPKKKVGILEAWQSA